ITDHIYGRGNVISRNDRPNIFVKELYIYLDYLKDKVADITQTESQKQKQYWLTFTNNLKDGISYYEDLFENIGQNFESIKAEVFNKLKNARNILDLVQEKIENLDRTVVAV